MMGGRGGGGSIASKSAAPSAAPAAPKAADTGSQMQNDILQVYRDLRNQFDNDWVILSELRRRLDGSREDQDKALMSLVKDRKIRLIPEENQKVLSPADHNAAIKVSGEFKHLIGIV